MNRANNDFPELEPAPEYPQANPSTEIIGRENNVTSVPPTIPPLPVAPAPALPPVIPTQIQPPFAVDGTKPLARLLDQVTARTSPEPGSEVVTQLEVGTLVEARKLWKTNGGWVEIRIPGGLLGYMPASTRVNFITRAKLKAKEVAVVESPQAAARTVQQLTKGTQFWLIANTAADDPAWVGVRFDSGQTGYIPSDTKVTALPQLTFPVVAAAGHDILVGALWCGGGLVVTICTYNAVAQSGGTYLICWGPVLFGGIQLVRGLIRGAGAGQAPVYSRGNRG